MRVKPFRLKIIATHELAALHCRMRQQSFISCHPRPPCLRVCAVALFGITQMDINSWQQFLLYFLLNTQMMILRIMMMMMMYSCIVVDWVYFQLITARRGAATTKKSCISRLSHRQKRSAALKYAKRMNNWMHDWMHKWMPHTWLK